MNKIQVGKGERDMNTKGETKTSTKLLSPPHTILESSTQVCFEAWDPPLTIIHTVSCRAPHPSVL